MRKYLIAIGSCIILGIFLLFTANFFDIKEQRVNHLQENEINEEALNKVLDELVLDNEHNVKLIHNGNEDVAICSRNESIVLRSGITEEMLFNNEAMPNIEFKLHEIKINNDSFVGVSEYYPTMKTIECTEKIFKIVNNRLISFWSTNEIEFKLLNVNEQEVKIGCPLSTEPVILKLTESEGQLVGDRLTSLAENNIVLDESFWAGIQENLLWSITGCNWADVDGDGDDEMIISLIYHTVGALTPVHIMEKGILVFEAGDSVELCKVIFERDNKEGKLEPYFIGER